MSKQDPDLLTEEPKGVIAWMVHNRITPNLMMLVFILGGLFVSFQIKQEFFPEFDLDMVTVRVPYPGSSPEEVEQGIVLSIEEGIRSLDGVKEVTATAGEGWRAPIPKRSIRISNRKWIASLPFRLMLNNPESL